METCSRYQIFCKIIENGSFTRTANELHYSQSAISQSVQVLERDLGVTLLQRSRDGVRLTKDGEQFFPFIRRIALAEDDCARKCEEMRGLTCQKVVIGGFSSVGRGILPPVIKRFREEYPSVRFEILQGDYSDIRRWVTEEKADLGFVEAGLAHELPHRILYREPLMAVLPKGHRLAARESVSMEDLAVEDFIMIDEGEENTVRRLFLERGLSLEEEYAVYDDYSILAMVRQGLGVSALFRNVLQGFETGVEIRPIQEGPERTIALIWKDSDTLPLAATRFADVLCKEEAP